MKTKLILFAAVELAAQLLLTASDQMALPRAGGTVFSGAGATQAAIQLAVDDFRAALGQSVNQPGAPGDQAGRREINWDAVPNTFAAPNPLPPDFFNKNSARGAVYSIRGPKPDLFQVSANSGIAPVRFDNLGPNYSQIFEVFSAQRLFTAIGSNEFDVDFFVPGTQDRATVAGFGAVFTNVAIQASSSIEYFNSEGRSLGKFFVRVAPHGLSFLGVTFPQKIVAKVRITQGTAALGEADNPAQGVNVVVTDDFLYSEPLKREAGRY